MSEPSGDSNALEVEADRAAAAGDRRSARLLLERLTASAPDRVEPWIKLAATCRAEGDLPAALDAIGSALRVDPLGFMPLLFKASLLEAAGRADEAAEAYGHALAQRPEPVPAHLRGAVERAERLNAAYVDRLTERLTATGEKFGVHLTQAERRRVWRFASNIARKTKPFHSEPTHFHYPGLVEREFHDPEGFPWLAGLQKAAPQIVAEFNQLMASEKAELVAYLQHPEDVPLRQWKDLNRNPAWSAIHLIQNGVRIEANARHCPATMRLLQNVDQPDIPGSSPNAMFSLLAPQTRIPPHTGIANTRLVCHLPLIVPENCWFRVGAETRIWRVGEAWVFDDTIEHEAANDSEQLRVVFIFDLWHPGLSAEERKVVAALTVGNAKDEPGL